MEQQEIKQTKSEYMKAKISCKLCGHMVSRSNMSHHNKTARQHKKFSKPEEEPKDEIMTDIDVGISYLLECLNK